VATTPGIHRTILLHFGTSDQGTVSAEVGLMNRIATLIGDPANLLIPIVGIIFHPFGRVFSAAHDLSPGVQVDFIATTTGDAAIVLNLASLQTSAGVNVITWSVPVTYGF